MAEQKYTELQLKNAKDDAKRLIAESSIIRSCFVNMIIARQLYLLARDIADTELREGWEVQNLELVGQQFALAAHEKSLEPFQVSELLKNLTMTTLPFTDIVVQQQRHDAAIKQAEAPAESPAESDASPPSKIVVP